jgi:hypothetical protein
LDRTEINRLMVTIHKAIVASFDQGDWQALGFQTGTLQWVERHPRLLRSLQWNDKDYPDNALAALHAASAGRRAPRRPRSTGVAGGKSAGGGRGIGDNQLREGPPAGRTPIVPDERFSST